MASGESRRAERAVLLELATGTGNAIGPCVHPTETKLNPLTPQGTATAGDPMHISGPVKA